MENPKVDEVRSWLTKAQQDLNAATWLLESPHPLFNAVGFHCQQTAEKSLKAYLTWMDHPFEKTHSLVALTAICLQYSSDFEDLRTATTTLTPYAVSTRYPGDLPEISFQDASNAVGLAKQIWDFVISHLPQEARIHLLS